MTVSEKIKTMTPEESAYFFFNVFTTESFLDDFYCEQCKIKNDGCPVGRGECLSSSINLVKWLLEQPYEEVEQRLFKNGFKHFMRLN